MTEGRAGGPDIVEIAEAIRPELPRLVGEEAPSMGAKLTEAVALARAAPDPEARARAEDALYELLASHDRTREELDRRLPEIDEERGYDPLAGTGDPVAADRYECPRGDYAWPVFSLDDPPPPDRCPVHQIPLVFKAAADRG